MEESPMTAAVDFTAEEKQALAAAITRAAWGIAECWGVLARIGNRIGAEWEPEETSVADIAELSTCQLKSAAVESIDADFIAARFAGGENWTKR